VDLMARRPLDTRGREIAVNVRGETNSLKTQVPGVASPTGNRISLSYLNQFADNTVGVAVGFAHLESTTQSRVQELDQYGDFAVFGLPIGGIPDSKFSNPPENCCGRPNNAAMLPMFWTASQSTKKNTRDGLMAVLEYKPNNDLRSQLDLYYSKFDTHEVGGKLTSNMFATWGALFGGPNAQNTLTDVETTQVGRNTYATSATASALPTTTTNYDTKRTDTIQAIGWNTALKLDDKWAVTSDLSYSKDDRVEKYQEVYAGPWNSAANTWAYGAYRWNVPVNGSPQTFTPLTPGFLSGANNGIKFGDVTGFDYVPGDPRWTGVIRSPKVEDEIKTLRLSAKRSLDGMFSAFTGGANYTARDKSVASNENRLIIPLNGSSTCGGVPCNRDIPTDALGKPLDMSWMGVGQFVRIDVPYLVNSGALTTKIAELGQRTNDSSVSEQVTTAFAMLDIDTDVAGVPVRGNVGVQAVHTKQEAEGWEYRGNNDNVDFSLLFKRKGGTSYSDVLPSLNLVAEITPSLITRFGLGTTTARPKINDMRAGTSTPSLLSTDPNDVQSGGFWSTAYAGNPELKPWKAHAIDLSIEKYFGKRSYISLAAFRKNLVSYITYATSARDNSNIPLPPNLDPNLVVQKFGPVFQPVNGSGGKLEGIELAASLEAALVSPMFDGFGIQLSASKLRSSIRDQRVDQNTGRVIAGTATTIDGLSGQSHSLTAYYEKHGFSARISQRYRSSYSATTRDIFFRPTSRSQGSDKVVDMQLGYAFDDAGMYRGLSVLLQINNLTDTYTRNYKTPSGSAPDPTQLVPNYTYQFGRQILAGLNYKF
jgi:iron complex outermembrane recepter protein